MSKLNLPQVPADEIFLALRKTPAGKYLQTAHRFGVFKTDKEDLKKWRQVLGPSALTLSHMTYIYKETQRLLEIELTNNPNVFNQSQQEKLLLAAVCHDFGEAIVDGMGIGDVQQPLKTKKHELLEYKIFKNVMDGLPLHNGIKEKMIIAYEDVVVDDTSVLHHYFRLIEHVDYFTTAINVTTSAKKRFFITHGKLLVGDVLSNTIHYLLNNIRFFPSILKRVENKANLITSAFNYSRHHFQMAELDGLMKKHDIEPVWNSWNDFLLDPNRYTQVARIAPAAKSATR